MFAFFASECGWTPEEVGSRLTLRQIDYLLAGVRDLNDIDKDKNDVDDEDIDRQFTDTILAGREVGTPYNIKTVRVEQPTTT